ncbi:MAG: hypothetical protein ISQ06_12255 [Planctomycetaceae bacterium]|jgi:hypothetical protein|nr:hypothetical protein [Planctomycetaceae bacterium]
MTDEVLEYLSMHEARQVEQFRSLESYLEKYVYLAVGASDQRASQLISQDQNLISQYPQTETSMNRRD